MSEETVGTLAVKVKNHKERLDGHSKDIEKIKDRLPNWATFFMSFLGLVIGAMLSALISRLT